MTRAEIDALRAELNHGLGSADYGYIQRNEAGRENSNQQGERRCRMTRELVKIANGYKFWKFFDGDKELWNITPALQDAPEGGYRSQTYIEHIKHQQF